MIVFYSVDDDPLLDEVVVPDSWNMYRPKEQEDIAEKAAYRHFMCRDANRWPKVVYLYDAPHATAMASFNVYMEMEPVFSAVQINTDEVSK